mgnify:CR=1 FL=1
MSMLIRVKLPLANAETVKAACRRRFRNVAVSGSKLTATTLHGFWFSIDLDKMEVSCDSDCRDSVMNALQQANAAEAIIEQAQSFGYQCTETVGQQQELVLELEV